MLARLVLSVLILATLLVGCAAPLRVATSGDYPPFSVRGEKGAYAGFDVELARAYARDTDRRLELVPFRWPELLDRAAAGDFDLAMSGITVRPERVARYPMTRAVARADAVVLVRTDAERGPLDLSARRIAVNRGGHLERVARGYFRRAALVTVDDNRSLEELVRGGSVDGVVTDSLEAATFGDGFRTAVVLRRDRKAYLGLRAEEVRRMDDWLDAREADGFLTGERARHLGDPPPPAPCVERVVDFVARRLMLMPFVAEAKRVGGQPVEAPERERAVRARARSAAPPLGLESVSYESLVSAQIELAKRIQRRVLAAPAVAARVGLSLDPTLRQSIDAVDRSLRAALACAVPIRLTATDLAVMIHQAAFIPELVAADLQPVASALRTVSPLR